MRYSLTRRKILSALTAGTAVAIAGCGSDEPADDGGETTDEESGEDDEHPGVDDTQDKDENDEPEGREPENVLFIAGGEEHTIGKAEKYDAVEIEPTGAVLFEPNSSLKFHDLTNT